MGRTPQERVIYSSCKYLNVLRVPPVIVQGCIACSGSLHSLQRQPAVQCISQGPPGPTKTITTRHSTHSLAPLCTYGTTPPAWLANTKLAPTPFSHSQKGCSDEMFLAWHLAGGGVASGHLVDLEDWGRWGVGQSGGWDWVGRQWPPPSIHDPSLASRELRETRSVDG